MILRERGKAGGRRNQKEASKALKKETDKEKGITGPKEEGLIAQPVRAHA